MITDHCSLILGSPQNHGPGVELLRGTKRRSGGDRAVYVSYVAPRHPKVASFGKRNNATTLTCLSYHHPSIHQDDREQRDPKLESTVTPVQIELAVPALAP
jgi:hypothetical protein